MARPGITVIVSSSATVGPPGPQGPQGIQGIQGPQGDGVPDTVDAEEKQVVTYNGSEAEWGYVESVFLKVQNNEGSDLSAGTPVYAKGISGDSILVGKADANDSSKMPCIGLLLEDTLNGATGEIITAGLFNKTISNLTNVSEGDTVYVSITGGLTTNRPNGSDQLVQNVGVVLQTNTSGTNIQKMKVSAIGRTNDIPNLDTGKFFIGGPIGDISPYTLPTSDGTNKQVLQTNGQGVVTFSNISEIGQFVFDTTQAVGAGTNDYVLTYDNSDQKIRLEPNDTGGIASITGAAPISVTTGATPTVSISPASTSADGFMSQSDKVKLNGIETSADVTDIANVNDAIDHMDSFHLSPQSPRPSDWILIKQDGGDLEYVEFNEVSKVNSLNLTSAGDYGLGSQIWYYGNTSTNAGRIYYLNTSGTWTIASASAPNTGGTSLLAVAAGSNSSTDGMILNGFVYMNGGVSGNIGMPVYLTTGTNQSGGLPVNTAPSSVGEVVRVVGNKIDANILFFNPDQHFEIV